MQIISDNIVLFPGEGSITLYIESATSFVVDEKISGAVGTSLTPTEASALAHALLGAARAMRAARSAALHEKVAAILRATRGVPPPPWDAA